MSSSIPSIAAGDPIPCCCHRPHSPLLPPPPPTHQMLAKGGLDFKKASRCRPQALPPPVSRKHATVADPIPCHHRRPHLHQMLAKGSLHFKKANGHESHNMGTLTTPGHILTCFPLSYQIRPCSAARN
jgi:hypothetical protein